MQQQSMSCMIEYELNDEKSQQTIPLRDLLFSSKAKDQLTKLLAAPHILTTNIW